MSDVLPEAVFLVYYLKLLLDMLYEILVWFRVLKTAFGVSPEKNLFSVLHEKYLFGVLPEK